MIRAIHNLMLSSFMLGASAAGLAVRAEYSAGPPNAFWYMIGSAALGLFIISYSYLRKLLKEDSLKQDSS